MTDQDIRSVLARMAGAPSAEAAGPAITPARALRTAFARAAESAGGLKAAVSSVGEDTVPLDAVADALSDGDLVLALASPEGAVAGVAALDREMRAAFVEAQTMGRLSAVPAPDRPVSVADAALCAPVVDAFLTETAVAAAPTPLAGWANGLRSAGRIDGARGAALRLPEDRYRLMRLEIDLGVPGRAGRVLLALPAARGAPPADPEPTDWADSLHRSILCAPAVLTAVLHRMSLPLARLEAMAPGDLLPLDGVTVSSIRLEGAGATMVTTAKLGQVGGMKAVRLESPPAPELREARPPPAPPPRLGPTGEGRAPPVTEDHAAPPHPEDDAHALPDASPEGHGVVEHLPAPEGYDARPQEETGQPPDARYPAAGHPGAPGTPPAYADPGRLGEV